MFGTDASLAVDLFLLLLVVSLPFMAIAILLVRRGHRRAHAAVMTTAFVMFLVALVAFEIDVHFGEYPAQPPRWPLTIHLCFAVPCLFLWVRQILTAKHAAKNPAPHHRRGRVLFALLVVTVATGVWLYRATF